MHLEEQKFRLMRGELFYCVEGCVDWSIARCRDGLARPIDLESEIGLLRSFRAADHAQADEADPLRVLADGIIDQRDDILVEDVLLLVRQILEAAEHVFER